MTVYEEDAALALAIQRDVTMRKHDHRRGNRNNPRCSRCLRRV
jgi:hypothetical protein